MLTKLYEKNNNPKDIDRIVQLMNDGGIIVLPTDTVYAICCSGLKSQAVERICKLKKIDPAKHHLSIICSDLSHISEYAKVSNATFKLMKRNLPGPFTFVLNTSNNLPKIFRSRKEVGIRVPDNNIVREICQELDAPIFSTTVPHETDEDIEYMTDPELIAEKLGDQVDLVVDGGIGGIAPSTVVDCREDHEEIIRQGKGILII
ncbi:L-threonylcarbamoyladenylate synthase [Phocaeicola abscessus]|uniref:L-threonylcarbamoyladenylate synthase n=1 Tax=Phocaeicola abscessus TaxID=555313 RepID=UPI000386E1A3|nr:L-threonylcarbamoyladenylate synthase [Phocaeicola abscessus]EPT33935.1 tRNA threonylcarbamoyl adenosine modification protein, Sua5/YciO/YrdC/YwlC family [Bacteroidetes bacterium oral taxon 272 str. F0290]